MFVQLLVDAYKADERVLKQIVYSNTECTNPQDKLKLITYYQSTTTSTLIMKNNQTPPPPQLQRTNLIYEYKCPIGKCERQNNSYIGLTTTTLSRRLTMHLQHGGPKHHAQHQHNTQLTRDILVQNTTVIATNTDSNRLHIMEALLIFQHKPPLNNQYTGLVRTLKLYNNNSH